MSRSSRLTRKSKTSDPRLNCLLTGDPILRSLYRNEVSLNSLNASQSILLKDDPAQATFEVLVTSIIAQQVSKKAGDAILARFNNLFQSGGFPKIDEVMKTDQLTLRGSGISIRKAGYILGIADALSNGKIRPEEFSDMDDASIKRLLTTLPGVGPWTANMFLMFALKRQDILPCEDLGIRRGLVRYLQVEGQSAEDILRGRRNEYLISMSEKWKPYRSSLSLLLWEIAKEAPGNKAHLKKGKTKKTK